jgi:DNA topoisomerase-3
MHSYADRKTHEFFHNRDYPDPDILGSIYKKLTKKPVERDILAGRLSLDSDLFDRALEKLEIHGGAERTPESELVRGDVGWQKTYLIQRDHKLEQLHFMVRFAESHGCRMVHMIRHFGDQEDNGAPCGLCDACAPSRVIAGRFREPSRDEEAALSRILATLARDGEQATGKLYRETFPDSEITRRSFEHLLAGLCRAGLVTVQEAAFEKNGEQINYQRASLTAEGWQRGSSVSAGITLPKESKKSQPARGIATKTNARTKTKAASKVNAGTKAKTRSKWYFINLNRRAKKRTQR